MMMLRYEKDELEQMTTDQLKEIQGFLERTQGLVGVSEQNQILSSLDEIDAILHARMPKG